MNQEQLIFDIRYPNAKPHLVRSFLVALSKRNHEVKAAENLKRDSAGFKGKFLNGFLIFFFFLIPFLAYQFGSADLVMPCWMAYSACIVLVRRTTLYDPLIKGIKLKVVAPLFPAKFVIPTYKTIHRTLPVELPPPL